jgi:hypothetical protein
MLVSGCWPDDYTPELHLLPEGYEGAVVVFYGRPDSGPTEYKDDTLVVRVSPDGSARVAPPQQEGVFPLDFIRHGYVDDEGQRFPLPEDVSVSRVLISANARTYLVARERNRAELLSRYMAERDSIFARAP